MLCENNNREDKFILFMKKCECWEIYIKLYFKDESVSIYRTVHAVVMIWLLIAIKIIIKSLSS